MTESLPVRAALAMIGFWQRWVSPLMPPACRFHPSCSEYCAESIRRHGVARGSGRGLLRLLRCQPLSRGGFDPVR
jgi:putative membrane protein insertion efficiency factor